MDVDINDQELAMTVLCGLNIKFEHPNVLIYAIADDVTLTMDFMKRILLQEEARMVQRAPEYPSGEFYLIIATVQDRRGR